MWFGLVIQDKNAIGALEQRVAAAKLEVEDARTAVEVERQHFRDFRDEVAYLAQYENGGERHNRDDYRRYGHRRVLTRIHGPAV